MSTPTTTRDTLEKIAKKIRFLLQNESLTVNNLASRLGVSKEYLREVIDARANPTRNLIQKICTNFAVKPEFFGPAIRDILWEEPEEATANDEGDLEKLEREIKQISQTVGVLPDEKAATSGKGKKTASKRRRKFDLAELAVHHQALLECLLQKKLICPDNYVRKVDDIRSHTKLA